MSQAGPSEEYYARLAHTSRGPLRPPSPPSSPILPAQRTNQEELEHLASDSLYAVLNVDRNASPSELKERYRSLASIFHPDKQADDQARQAANARFQEIQRAYEILTDPSRRMIYDSFGEEGLRTTWDLGPKNLSPEEMKKLFQKQAAEFQRQEAEALVSSKGTSSISIDARTVFISKDKFVRPEDYQHDVISRLKRARPGQVVMTHSFEVPVNERTQVIVEGQAVSVKGRGGANIFGTIRHQFSPRLWMELRAGALEPRIITLDSTYTHDENTYMTVNAIWQTWLAPPTSTITLGRKLSLTATGFIRYKPGFYTLGPWGKAIPEEVQLSEPSSLAVGVTSAAKTGTGWTVETQAGVGNSHLAADWSTLLLGVRLRFGGHASTAQGVALFVDAGRKITEHVRGGIRLGVDIFGGITMRFRFSRLGQNINIPVKLTYDLNPYVLAGALALPAGTYCAVHYFYLETRQKDSLKRRLKALRKENAELIAERKAKALDAVSLMQRTASLNQATERDSNGLIILHADYGLETSFTDRGIKENEEEEDVIDVTIPIQALVSNSKLVIPGGRSKSNLIGFWDPCIGEKKKLRVRYLFRGKVHQVTAGDTAVLRAPLELHLLQ